MKKLFSLLFVTILVLGGCSSKDDTFVQGLSMQVESLDVAQASAGQTFILLADTFAGLEKVDGDADLQNGVATSYDVSSDGLTYTFHLRDDVKWVDNTGTEVGTLTANDYEYSFKRMVDPNTASVYSYIYEIIENATDISNGNKEPDSLGVTAIDDYTLEVKLDHVAPYFPSMLTFGSFFAASKEAIETYGDDYGTSAETTWYSGPYYITEYDPTYSIKVTKNPLYYDADNVQVDNIEYRLVEDSMAGLNAFDTGELDYTVLTTDEEISEAKDKYDVLDNMKGTYYLVANYQESSKTSNETLRHALSYGLDRDKLTSIAFGDLNKPVEYIIPNDVTPGAYDGLEYRDIAGNSLITYDADKANELFDSYMEEMGYNDRSQIEVTLLANSDLGETMPEAIQASYKQNFGITVDVITQPYEQFSETSKSGGFDIMLANWGADYADPSTYMGIWQSSQVGGQNKAFYASSKFDNLYEAADQIQDPEARFEAFAKCEKLLVDEAIATPFYQNNSPYVISDGYTMPTHLFFKISHEYMTYNE